MLRLWSTGTQRRAYRLPARPHVMAYRKKCSCRIYYLPNKKMLIMRRIIFCLSNNLVLLGICDIAWDDPTLQEGASKV